MQPIIKKTHAQVRGWVCARRLLSARPPVTLRNHLVLRSLAGSFFLALLLVLPPVAFQADTPPPKSDRMTCGKCPDGYATTGRTNAPQICKDEDPTLVECILLGRNQLSVCGSCPEGYVQIGTSLVPARCGSTEGGRMSQCQLPKLEGGMPDPSQGGVFCPPNCAGQMPTPGQGTLPPPPKIPRIIEEEKK
ncbi:MAG: hypothetical protein HY581_02930 [Nitrospirae bacterium]|nr:hypothetical protein [Nitrospirota bacterium]